MCYIDILIFPHYVFILVQWINYGWKIARNQREKIDFFVNKPFNLSSYQRSTFSLYGFCFIYCCCWSCLQTTDQFNKCDSSQTHWTGRNRINYNSIWITMYYNVWKWTEKICRICLSAHWFVFLYFNRIDCRHSMSEQKNT